jgi:hypothetical protein
MGMIEQGDISLQARPAAKMAIRGRKDPILLRGKRYNSPYGSPRGKYRVLMCRAPMNCYYYNAATISDGQ